MGIKSTMLSVLLVINFMASAASMQGQPAPSFNLKDQAGKTHQLADYQGQWLVVYFYPKDDTTGCTIEAKAFKDNYQTLQAMNTDVLGVSLDDAASHQAFIDKYQLPFNLLVDDNKQMSRDYGVDGGMAFFEYAKRQTFIINPEGHIAVHFEKVDPQTHVDQVLEALNKLQNKAADGSEVSVTEIYHGGAVFGQQWPRDASAVPLSQVLENPAEYQQQQHVITGEVTRVCQKQGCWMILTDHEQFVRVDFNDHAFLIPKDSQGSAQVYGRLITKELTEKQREHYAAEGSGDLPAVGYELVADAVRIIGS